MNEINCIDEEICIGCAATDCLIPLRSKVTVNNSKSTYCNMLKNCFEIKIPHSNHLQHICGICAEKLRKAYEFKTGIESTIKAANEVDTYKQIKCENDYSLEYGTIEFLEENRDEMLQYVQSQTRERKTIIKTAKTRHEEKATTDVRTTVERKRRLPRTGVPPSEQLPYKLSPEQSVCPICKQDFKNTHMLKIHMNMHYPNFQCELCGKGFAIKRSLHKHAKVHEQGPFSCEICNKEVRTKNALLTHVQKMHRNSNRNTCRKCGEKFQVPRDYREHMERVHNFVRRSPCQQCGKQFKAHGDLLKHIRRIHEHRPERQCPLCPERFIYHLRLDQHLKKVHDQLPVRTKETIKCAHCKRRFHDRTNYNSHLKTTHSHESSFHCDRCAQEFPSVQALESHFEVVHMVRILEIR